jgi:uncharacterized protein with HEPN domain
VGELSREQFEKSQLHQSAVIRELQVFGEAARMISSDAKSAHGEIPWQTIPQAN